MYNCQNISYIATKCVLSYHVNILKTFRTYSTEKTTSAQGSTDVNSLGYGHIDKHTHTHTFYKI